MLILPAIDLYEGKAVRLLKGDYAQMTVYSERPCEVAADFRACGAQWIHMVDLEGARDGSTPNFRVVADIAQNSGLKVEIGGGIRSMQTVEQYLEAGVSRVILGTAAVKDPDIIRQGAERFGRQCIVLAVDARRNGEDSWEVYINGGRTPTGIDCLEWVKRGVELGAGEILLTSMDADGTKDGYDIPLTRAVSEAVDVPVIASGGAGTLEHFYDVLTLGKADAVLAASVFHYGQVTVREVKNYLKSRGVEVRF